MGEDCGEQRHSPPSLHGAFSTVVSLATQFGGPALPAITQTTAAGLVFISGVAATQYVGLACRISCASPLVAPLIGGAAVGIFSAVAGQTAGLVKRLQAGEGPIPPEGFNSQEMIVHGILGMVAYKALGGHFRNVLPSDLQHPGALAQFSIPAQGTRYASGAQRDLMGGLFRLYGCHHCGKRTGTLVSDHMPPSADIHGRGWAKRVEPLTRGAGATSKAVSGSLPWWSRLLRRSASSSAPATGATISGRVGPTLRSSASASSSSVKSGSRGASPQTSSCSTGRSAQSIGKQTAGSAAKPSQSAAGKAAGSASKAAGTFGQRRLHLGAAQKAGVQQRLFPQCVDCSVRQSQAVKQGRRTLVLHRARGMPQPFKLTGFFIGLFPASHTPPPGQAPHSWKKSTWASAGGPVAVLASRLMQGPLEPLRRRFELLRPPNAAEQVARMREDLAEKGWPKVQVMEGEVRELRAQEALVNIEMIGMVAERGDANLGAMQWVGESESSDRGTLVEELGDELERIAKRKERLKSEIRWLKQRLR